MANTRTLILLRHAAAGNAPRDHDRPLTDAGNRDAAAAGDWIRDNVGSVDAVLCSTAVRTRQTLAATMARVNKKRRPPSVMIPAAILSNKRQRRPS